MHLTTTEAAEKIGCAPGTLVKQRSLYRRGVRGIAGGPRFLEPGGNRIVYRVSDVAEHYAAIIAQSYNPKPKWFRKVKDAVSSTTEMSPTTT
jgi:hypothetical protein